ncbi:peptidase [Rhodanobacter panaciterrae]|uniref:Peptidase n=1 Tax=Rhodanobacter panaciterrae TaxID=490572 RepID=A0ABQ2ZLG0_9GAMM|nr:S9 family peptidase [Rhodanobacter panaciterrae]GGY18468.1 peptidase [Rhodanobacter panaciterrae]
MKSTRYFAYAACCVFALSLSAHAATTAQAFQLNDLQRVVSLSEPQISPDGKRIAVVVSTPDWKTDKSQQELDLVDVASGVRRALTWKREGLSSPRWSPDGARLAFIAKDAETKEGQLYVMPMDGGDALRITETKRGVDAYSWSPDGKQIAFVSEDEPANAKAIKEHDDAFQVTDNHFLTRATLTPWHLWLVPSAGGTAKQLTRGSYSLQTDQQDNAPVPTWSRDGRSIAFTRFPGAYWGPSFHSVIAAVDAGGGEPHTLVPAEGAVNAMYAPDSDSFAFMRPRNGDQNNGNAVYVTADGNSRDVTEASARNFNSYVWLPHGKALVLAGEDGTHSVLWEQPLTGAAKKLDLGEVEAGADVSVSKTGALAFVGSTTTHPAELYVMDSVSAKPRRLTNLNAFVDNLALGRTESIEWQGSDGFHEDGVLTYPVGYQRGQSYPLALVIHGGPEAASTVKFAALPQLLAAAGFAVFQPNYRGSINLGDAYQHAIFRDTGVGPGKDVMAGVDAVQKLGFVDAQRIGVSGWSYGGYMTTWLTGHYPVWKAAVSGAALTDWVMDYTISYYQTGDTYFFGGSPWTTKDHDIWREQSPIAYAHNVTAPTLIMGDVGDPNVPLVNSYEWYHALRDNGVPVEFYAYPADTHFPKDIVRTTDVYRRWVSWMTQHLQPTH